MAITSNPDYPEDSLGAIGADGAFTIGDGSGYGQDDNEQTIKAMYRPTVPTPGNAIGLLQKELTKMPLDALQFFKDLVPPIFEGAFNTVSGAVQSILASLSSAVTFLTTGKFAQWVGDQFDHLATEARQVFDVLSGAIVTPINAAVQAVKDWWNGIQSRTSKLTATGGYQASQLIGQVGKDAVEGLTDLGVNVAGFFKGIYDTWFGTNTGAGTVTQANYTIQAIKDAVISGYNVTTFTSDTTNWQLPSPLPIEVLGILIGGGQNGSSPGNGGLHGSYVVYPLTLTGVTALDIKIGTAGNYSYIRVANTSAPHTGTIIAQSAGFGSVGGQATALGFIPTSSVPGNGGNGASSGVAATAGGSTPAATGGAGGASGNAGSPGGDGGSVSAGAQVKCGGAGGGGGGRATAGFQQGGQGGDGGYPGGGGGGSGPSNQTVEKRAGFGAPGVVWIFSKGTAPTP